MRCVNRRHTVLPGVLLFAAMLLVLPWSGPTAAEADFFSGSADLPLMPGLEEQADAAVNFDSPYGRIADAVAAGAVARADVLAFYRETLPALGWRQTGDARFRRENEVLELRFAQEPLRLVVRFSLAPPGS